MALACGHIIVVSKSQARKIKAEGHVTQKCTDCDAYSKIVSMAPLR